MLDVEHPDRTIRLNGFGGKSFQETNTVTVKKAEMITANRVQTLLSFYLNKRTNKNECQTIHILV